MTSQNHAFNRMLAHLISHGMPAVQAAELVDQCRDEARAQAWNSPDAARVAEDAQSWHLLRAAVLATVDDPHIWDDGASEAEVLAAWVTRRGRAKPVSAVPPVRMDDSAVTPTAFITEAASAPRRPCGGPAGKGHKPHMYERSGAQFFCVGAPGIPQQIGPDPSEQDAAS